MRSIRDRVGAFLCFWTDWTLKQLPAFYGAFTAVIRGARPAGAFLLVSVRLLICPLYAACCTLSAVPTFKPRLCPLQAFCGRPLTFPPFIPSRRCMVRLRPLYDVLYPAGKL